MRINSVFENMHFYRENMQKKNLTSQKKLKKINKIQKI